MMNLTINSNYSSNIFPFTIINDNSLSLSKFYYNYIEINYQSETNTDTNILF